MDWVLIFALWTTFAVDVLPAPSSPPTIITTKTSPLCTAVREVIAPVVLGLADQDRVIGHGASLMKDVASIVTASDDPEVQSDIAAMQNVRLSNEIDHLAADNIKVHQFLDRLDVLKPTNPEVAAELAPLRVNLLAIDGDQAATLNIIAGRAYTDDFARMVNRRNPLQAALDPESVKTPSPNQAQISIVDGIPQAAFSPALGLPTVTDGALAGTVKRTLADEATLLPSLRPIIKRCI